MANEAPQPLSSRDVVVVLAAALVIAVGLAWAILRLYGNHADLMTNRQIGNDLIKLGNDQTQYILVGNRKLDDLTVKMDGVLYVLHVPAVSSDTRIVTTRP